MLLVAALYILAARASYLMILQPMQLPAIWPTSGFALAAGLIWGWPAGFGVFLGAFISVLGLHNTLSQPPVAAFLALGAFMQSMLANGLLKRYIRPFPPVTIRHTLLALSITAFSALLGTLFWVLGMCHAGLIPWSDFVGRVWVWWLSITTGNLLFTPTLIYIWLYWRKQQGNEPLLWLLTSLFIGVSLASVLLFSNSEMQRSEERLQRNTAEVANLLEDKVEDEIQDLVAIKTYLHSSAQLKRGDFAAFAGSIVSNSNATLAFEWLPRVTLADRPAYEQSMRDQGYKNYSIYEVDASGNRIPALQRSEYFPIDFIQPFESNKIVFGYDLGSQADRLSAIQQARKNNLPAVTIPINLVQNIGTQTGILILMPIYSGVKPAKDGSNLLGMVAGVYRMQELVNAALKDLTRHDMEIYLYDMEKETGKPQFLIFSPSISGSQSLPAAGPPAIETLQTGLFVTEKIQIVDHTWLLVARPGSADISLTDEWINALILLVGFGLATSFLGFVRSRQRTEAILARSEVEFRNLSDHALIGIMRMKLSGEILYANHALAQMVGLASPDQLLSTKAGLYLKDPSQFADLPELFRVSPQIHDQEIDILSLQGQIHHVLYSASLQNDVVSATIIDITEREQAQAKLSSSEHRYRQLVDRMPGVVYSFSSQHGGFYYSPGVEAIFGMTPDHMLSTPMAWYDSIHPDDVVMVEGAVNHFVSGGDLYIEYRIYDQSGKMHWLADRAIGRDVVAGETIIHGLAIDITDRKLAEENLITIQNGLEQAQKVAQLGSWELDIETGHGAWSKEMFRLLGLDPAVGVPHLSQYMEMIHPEDRQSLFDAQKLAIDMHEPITVIYRTNPGQGKQRYFESRIQPVKENQGLVTKVSGTLLDITKRRVMELEISKRVKELTCLFTVGRLLEVTFNSEEFVCQQIVDTLLPAMQFPALVAALIELDGNRYFTDRYTTGLTCCITADILVAGVPCGFLRVFYTRQEEFIIPEEQDLIDNLARMLAQWLERRQSEKALRASNERFNQLAENIQEVFWIHDVNNQKILYISPAYETIWGRSVEGVYNNPNDYLENILPEDQQLMDVSNQKQGRGETTNIEYRVIRPDGNIRWVWDRGFPIFDENGVLVRTAGVATDITDLKIAQLALEELNRDLEKRVEERTAEVRQNEEIYRALFENSNDGIFIMSTEGVELRANQQGLDLLGYTQEEWHGFTNSKLIVPEETQDAERRFAAALRGEPVPLYERTFIRKDGKKIEAEINLSAVRDTSGKIILVQSVVRDITERKRTEAALRANSELFDKFMRYSPIYAFVKDVTPDRSLVLYSSENYIDMIGVTGSQMVGKTMHDFFSAEFAEKITDDDWSVVSRGEMITIEEELNGRNYTSIKFPIFQGERTLLAGYTIDITERKNSEDRLRESEERYRQAISAADAVPYSLDYGLNRYTFMGEGIGRLTGYTREEMTPDIFKSSVHIARFHGELAGKTTDEVVHLVRSNNVVPNGVLRSDFQILTKNGEQRWLSDSSVQLFQENGHVWGSIGILQDITDRKAAEESLRESRDKLSIANATLEKASRMKDEFLASMSHELRTPLTGILGLSEALQMQTQGPLNERQLKALSNIEKSGRHLLELINDILDLSKIEAGKLDLRIESLQVAEVCQASLQLVKGMAYQKKHNINFVMNMSSISMKADTRLLKQMLVNLLSNAIKFTPVAGQIGLEVEARPDQKVICFSVWDKGIGIQAEELGKLFQPFVQLDSSLARQYSGTGLGLALVQRMAELHGGSVKVESKPGEGSRFTIILPWLSDETNHLPDISESVIIQLSNAMTVEDNDLDAEQITRYLEEIGMTNVIQPIVRGALDRAVVLRPNVILLDLNLSDGFGMDLLTQLKADERTHNIPVIIMSVEDLQTEAFSLGAVGYLIKPFNLADLRNALTKAAALQPERPILVVGKNGSIPLVLVTDDNELILETISDFLRSSGFRVASARSGHELLERAPDLKPDIILVDIQMPGLDGMETMRRVRAHSDPELASTPLIAITALAMSGDRERCLAAGASEYISKPIVLKQLARTIIQLLQKNSNV